MADLYVGSCRMNSGDVYRKMGSRGELKRRKRSTEECFVLLVSVTQAGPFPTEKGYFISTAGIAHSSSSHNG